MIFEKIDMLLGIIKIYIFRALFHKRFVIYGLPKIYKNFKFYFREKSNTIIGKKLRARNDFTIRVEKNAQLIIGNGCFFNDGCSINCQKSILIGNGLLCGQNVLIFDHDHDYKNDISTFIKKEIKIGNNVWIGANSVILKGVTIGDNVVIGANSIINKDIPNDTVIYQKKMSKVIKRDVNNGK